MKFTIFPGTSKSKAKSSKLANCLIDKSFSIDEEELCTPLEPTQVGIFHLTVPSSPNSITPEDSTTSEEDDGIEDIIHIDVDKTCLDDRVEPNLRVSVGTIEDEGDSKGSDDDDSSESAVKISATPRPSILRKPSCFEAPVERNSTTRHIAFPSDELDLVSYREPEEYAWVIENFIPAGEILKIYQDSCKKHKTIELDTIKSQILEIKNNINHSATLKLASIKMSCEVAETLEDILKVANFHTLILQECEFTPQIMTEFLNSLHYYNSVCHFEIAMNFEDDDTWKSFCSACGNILALECLSFKGMKINEPYMRSLIHAIKNNPNIAILKFDSCMLEKLPTFYLVEALMTNQTIRELYLPSTGLYTKEADALQRFLVNNTHLKVLDISNNNLGDRGLEVLSKGLCNQKIPGVGLSVLVIFNNQITEKSGPVIKNIIIECKNLHTLNIGYNNLTDDVLSHISEALAHTHSLEGLGLQCTLLTCKGILTLAHALPANTSLQKINLKGNKAIQILGIEALCTALTNSKISKIEIDDNNRSCNDPEAYAEIVKKLNAICTVNRNYADESSDEDEEVLNVSQKISRKMSLSCEPKYGAPDPNTTFQIGSPLISPAPSPSPRSRFQIMKVPETVRETHSPITSKSRFKVTKVLPSPEEEEIPFGRFSNIRSSVSSNDSTESLTTLHLESDECQ
ncbi:protein phosphatase 1 regulatory subunit 37 homolog isoform X2 [Euwallacea fornicatus]|uniref:protein phosphatase 1 regulatory subunit 37 homolog isoform X2 n=1 Tax=Euwallacea fornicatus TaxID=995702 RepID=UPI00338D3ABC